MLRFSVSLLLGGLVSLGSVSAQSDGDPRDHHASHRHHRHLHRHSWVCDYMSDHHVPPEGVFTGPSWPGGVVPYEFAPNVSAARRNIGLAAMAEIEAVCRIRFVSRTTQPNWIYLFASTQGNNSPVGVQGGRQQINLFNWFTEVVAHEICHSLGYWHEQQRTDRNTYVRIETQNIIPGTLGNFNIVAGSQAIGPYDFDSIMHYGQFDFSSNGQRTITVLPPNQAKQGTIGTATELSEGDIEMLQRRYGGPRILSVAPNRVTSWNPGFVTMTGELLNTITEVRVGNVPTFFTVVSDTRIDFRPPSPGNIGTTFVTAFAGGVSATGSGFLTITGNTPPELEVPSLMRWNQTTDVNIHTELGTSNFLFFSPFASPSAIPGLVNLSIGGNFSNLLSLGSAIPDLTGTARFPVPIPPNFSLLIGYFEGVSFNPGMITTPLPVTGLASTLFAP